MNTEILAAYQIVNNPILLTSCDEQYFNRYAPMLVASAHDSLMSLHIHAINPSLITMVQLGNWYRGWNRTGGHIHKLSYSCEFKDLTAWSEIQKKVYYASARFRVARDYMNYCMNDENVHTSPGCLVIDVDSVVAKPLPWHKVDIPAPLGIFDRRADDLGNNEIEKRGMKVLANMYGNEPWPFGRIYDYIVEKNFAYWFLDQEAIYDIWSKYYDGNWFDIRPLKWIDYDFVDDSYIWSGKGDRKNSNPVYCEEQQYWFERFTQLAQGWKAVV